jgi:hypothetical protein
MFAKGSVAGIRNRIGSRCGSVRDAGGDGHRRSGRRSTDTIDVGSTTLPFRRHSSYAALALRG